MHERLRPTPSGKVCGGSKTEGLRRAVFQKMGLADLTLRSMFMNWTVLVRASPGKSLSLLLNFRKIILYLI